MRILKIELTRSGCQCDECRIIYQSFSGMCTFADIFDHSFGRKYCTHDDLYAVDTRYSSENDYSPGSAVKLQITCDGTRYDMDDTLDSCVGNHLEYSYYVLGNAHFYITYQIKNYTLIGKEYIVNINSKSMNYDEYKCQCAYPRPADLQMTCDISNCNYVETVMCDNYNLIKFERTLPEMPQLCDNLHLLIISFLYELQAIQRVR